MTARISHFFFTIFQIKSNILISFCFDCQSDTLKARCTKRKTNWTRHSDWLAIHFLANKNYSWGIFSGVQSLALTSASWLCAQIDNENDERYRGWIKIKWAKKCLGASLAGTPPARVSQRRHWILSSNVYLDYTFLKECSHNLTHWKNFMVNGSNTM